MFEVGQRNSAQIIPSIPSGAKALNFIGLSTYGLKPVPFNAGFCGI
jgi:hypothetical protein